MNPDAPQMRPGERGNGVLSTHILPTSATMLGVCMTLLSLSRLDDDQLSYWLIDKIVAGAAVVFLVSCFASFLSLRESGVATARAVLHERRAEFFFMCGIILLGLSAVLLAILIH